MVVAYFRNKMNQSWNIIDIDTSDFSIIGNAKNYVPLAVKSGEVIGSPMWSELSANKFGFFKLFRFNFFQNPVR